MARNQPPRKVLLRSPPHVMSCDRRPRKGKEVAERGKKGGISCVCVGGCVDGGWEVVFQHLPTFGRAGEIRQGFL